MLYYQVTTGECLLYPDLYKLLKFVIEEPRIKRMLILTNGVVMPQPQVNSCETVRITGVRIMQNSRAGRAVLVQGGYR